MRICATPRNVRRAFISFMVDTSPQLCLFNTPRIERGDTKIEIRPPLAFQVLVALALGRTRTQSRAEVAKLLFPGVDPKERRSQLRITLCQLRKRLIEFRISEIYCESGSDLRLDDAVTLDAEEVLRGSLLTRERLSTYCEPVLVGCQSRFAEKCRGLVKNVIEASLPSILASTSDSNDLWGLRSPLGDLCALYPLSATICASHLLVLRRLHLYEEAPHELVEFDTNWLESYGSQDRPDIDAVARLLVSPDEQPSQTRRTL